MTTRFGIILSLILPLPALAKADAPCPMHAQHEAAAGAHDRMDGVNQRGDQAMGFDHAKTIHHFRLFPDGGAIQVEANDPADAESRDMIREHLSSIAKAFSEGDYALPMFIHDQVPPGVSRMKHLKNKIHYRYESSDRGGRVRITSGSKKAIRAVHAFLAFQIKDHATGDPGTIESDLSR